MTAPPAHRVRTGAVTRLDRAAKGTARHELHGLGLLLEDGDQAAIDKETTT